MARAKSSKPAAIREPAESPAAPISERARHNLLKQANDAVKLGAKVARIQKVAIAGDGAAVTALGGAVAHFGWQLIPQ